jgi:hypothetical protein
LKIVSRDFGAALLFEARAMAAYNHIFINFTVKPAFALVAQFMPNVQVPSERDTTDIIARVTVHGYSLGIIHLGHKSGNILLERSLGTSRFDGDESAASTRKIGFMGPDGWHRWTGSMYTHTDSCSTRYPSSRCPSKVLCRR